MKRLMTFAVALVAATMVAGSAGAGTVYHWTGAENQDLNVAANWLVDGSVPSAPPGNNADQPMTPTINDALVFDSATWTRAPQATRALYTRTNTRWGSIVLNNGTISYANDANNSGNYSWGGTDTVVVGNGNATAAVLNFNVLFWNHGDGGTAGTKTYVVNSDGTLNSNRAGVNIWSNSASLNTVMRLVGGSAVFVGSLREDGLTNDSNSYFSFEDYGSSLTFAVGAIGTSFGQLSDVEAAIGDSFRLGASLNSENAALQVTEAEGKFTITASAGGPPPNSAYEDWADGAIFDADTSDDGIANGVAWVLGALNPTVNVRDEGLLPTIETVDDGGEEVLVFTFQRRKAALDEAEVEVEYSTDLADSEGWNVAVDNGSTIIIVETPNGEFDEVEVRFKTSAVADGGRLFVRLRVAQMP